MKTKLKVELPTGVIITARREPDSTFWRIHYDNNILCGFYPESVPKAIELLQEMVANTPKKRGT